MLELEALQVYHILLKKGPLRKDVDPTCRATVGMRIEAATFQTIYLQETEILQIHIGHLSVELLCKAS